MVRCEHRESWKPGFAVWQVWHEGGMCKVTEAGCEVIANDAAYIKGYVIPRPDPTAKSLVKIATRSPGEATQ